MFLTEIIGKEGLYATKMMDRSYYEREENIKSLYRITQKEDALCIYQLFTDSISQDMFEKVLRKGLVMDETIKAEKDK